MANFTHLSSLNVQGSVETSAQGKLIGSFDTMPVASEANVGQIVLYTGPTGTYVQGKYYVSNGSAWTVSAASPSAVTVDSSLSDTSTNPVQNKVIKSALDDKVSTEIGKGLSTNDYTTPEKNKLAGISAGAQVNVIEEVQLNGAKISPSSKAVNIDLSGYATKGDVSAIPKFAISVVSTLPTSGISTSTIYLKPNGGSSGNSYNEYIYVNSAWEKIGTTEVDLSGYVPTSRKVNGKALTGDITLAASDVGALATGGTAAKATADASGNNIVNTYATKTELTNGLAGKQNALTFDSAPTSGSSNPVTSGGVYSAINSKVNVAQGVGNAGKALVVGADGNVTPGEVSGGKKLFTGTLNDLCGFASDKVWIKRNFTIEYLHIGNNASWQASSCEVFRTSFTGASAGGAKQFGYAAGFGISTTAFFNYIKWENRFTVYVNNTNVATQITDENYTPTSLNEYRYRIWVD